MIFCKKEEIMFMACLKVSLVSAVSSRVLCDQPPRCYSASGVFLCSQYTDSTHQLLPPLSWPPTDNTVLLIISFTDTHSQAVSPLYCIHHYLTWVFNQSWTATSFSHWEHTFSVWLSVNQLNSLTTPLLRS